MARSPYPLQWPEGSPRTHPGNRQRSLFQLGFVDAYDGLVAELGRLKARNAVITTDAPLNSSGRPYARGAGDGDPGVAVWFVLDRQERVFACDRWPSHAENMRALALTIAALRGLKRWGSTDVVARAFAGFTALPPGSSEPSVAKPAQRPWREVFEVGAGLSDLDDGDLLVIVKSRHRKAMVAAHPDRGGDNEYAVELNLALEQAELELGRGR